MLKYINILFEENKFSYLMSITKKLSNQNISDQEISIINNNILQKNISQDYFEGKTLEQFQKETVEASIQMIEKGSSNNQKLPISQQHLIIRFLNNYILQVRKAKKDGLINFKE